MSVASARLTIAVVVVPKIVQTGEPTFQTEVSVLPSYW